MKKLSAVFTVLLLLVATSAWAAITIEKPAGLNGTYLFYTGYSYNSTGKITGKNAPNSTMAVFNSTKAGILSNGTGIAGGYNAVVSSYNGSAWTKLQISNATNAVVGFPAVNWAFDQDLKNITALTTLGANNATNATSYFVNTSGYKFMVGITNGTVNGTTSLAKGQANGTTLTTIYANGTFDGDVYNNTWDYYAYGIDTATAKPGFIIGQVVLGNRAATGNAAVKYYVYSGGTATDNTSSSITYNATYNAARNEMGLSRSGGTTLLQNGTVNADRNLITGYILGTDGDKLLVVMVRSASNLSTNDLKNRAFKLAYSGALSAANQVGNATAGLMAMSIDGNLNLDGDMARFNGTAFTKSDFEAIDLSGYTVALADTSAYGLSQSNMTIYAADGTTVVGSFYGKQAADKTMVVGIYEPVLSGAEQGHALAFLVPNPAATAQIEAAGAAYQSNSSATLAFHGIARNSTSYSQVGLRTQWSGIPSNFTPLTDVKGFNATFTEAQKDFYYTFQIKFTGLGDKIDNLRLYKVFPTSAKTVRAYNYAGSATPSVDGAWWISTDVADGYLNKNSVLVPSQEYYVNYVVKDNGNYDYKAASLQIGDPVVLGSVPTSSSSSSSSGCVFNPAAGFGLEWLLLMLAPMVAIVRSRFKK